MLSVPYRPIFPETLEVETVMAKRNSSHQETDLEKIWNFLETWNDRMTLAGAEKHIDAFLADMDRFRAEFSATRQSPAATPGPGGTAPGS
jgi:hypothetical protein